MNKVRIAVVGAGNIGSRHAHHIQQNIQTELVSVCDIQEERTRVFAAAGLPVFQQLEEMLQQVKPDVLSVCTPNYLHAPHTISGLQAGAHVICEKPMAISSAQSAAMMQTAADAGKTIFVVKQNRYNPPVQAVRQLLQDGSLGRIFVVNINCFWNRNSDYYQESTWRGTRAGDGGCLFTQFSHFVDIMYYLFGAVYCESGMIQNFNHPYTEVEDSGIFLLRSESGAFINFNFSTCSYEKNLEGAITILGEFGSVKIGGQYLNTIEYQHLRGQKLPDISIQAKSNDYGKYQGSMSNHDQVIQNVVDTLNGKGKAMTSDAEGHEVVRIIEAMYATARR
ncbi:MAG: Gfo/Idh/MocA family oxidoreductase [Chitinophagaceae bacterium]|nr:Gfo/Idh/MocA family oxidoreductase [Chitinophagaceae bacterium]